MDFDENLCTQPYKDLSQYSNTIVKQFGLVCEKKYLVNISISLFIFGVVLSSIFNIKWPTSKEHRKQRILLFSLIIVISSILAILKRIYIVWIILNFLILFSSGIIFANGPAYLNERIPPL